MSQGIKQLFHKALASVAGLPPVEELFIRQIEGGSINASYQVSTKDNRMWFCKFNDSRQFPDLFVKEAGGLTLLAQNGLFRIPAIIAAASFERHQALVLEWIGQGTPTPAFWTSFGEQLARLHRVTRPEFGLEEDNYMGALPQDNTPTANWPEFFIRHRLEPQVRLATDRGLMNEVIRGHFQRLYGRLPELFPPEPPALLHGDLWNGNFLCDTAGRPVLIDPAVYYGHRSMDLAMTTLFGGFDRAFYEAYDWHYPLPPDYRRQWAVCNLYPLLIHLNLFGEGYMTNILHTIQDF
jgi:protein-ribulosamine 3-kinase